MCNSTTSSGFTSGLVQGFGNVFYFLLKLIVFYSLSASLLFKNFANFSLNLFSKSL